MSKKKIDQRVQKMAINSEYTRNVLKSMGFAMSDIVKDLLPNTTDFAKSTVSAVDMIKDVRSNMGPRRSFTSQFKNIPQIKQTKEALKTVMNDLKTGNLYGSSDFGDEMDYGFDSDMFGDDGIEFIDDDSPSNQSPQNMINTLPVAKMIHASTEATVSTIANVAEQQMAVETEKMIINRKVNDSLISGLTAMNDNLATLVKFNAESTTKFHAASLKFYEDTIKMMESQYKKKDDISDLFGMNDSFDASGNLKLDNYLNQIKKNIADMKDNSMVGMAVDNILDPEIFKMLMQNPTKGMMQLVTKKLVPGMVKNSLKSIDETFSAILPAIIARVNSLEGDADLDKIFKIFGVKEKVDYKVNLDRYEKGQIPWDGESKKALVEVIPTYLRRIESAITGESERIFDYDKGEFIGIKNAKKRYDDKLREKEASGYLDTKFKLRDYILNETKDLNEVEDFGKDLEIYLSEMTKKGSLIRANEIRERDFFNGDEKRTERLINALKSLSVKDLTKMSINELNDSRKATQKYIDEANENSNLSGANVLYNGSYFNKDGKIKFDASQKGGMFNKKDKFGLSELDYLRDIRKALIRGIKVFPDNNIELSGWNPNIDLMNKEKNENEKYNESINPNINNNSNEDELEKNVFGIDNENINDILKDMKKRNKQGKHGGKLSKKIDNINDKASSFIMKHILGGGFDDEDDDDDTSSVDNENDGNLKEAVMDYFTGNESVDKIKNGYKKAKGLLGEVGSNFIKGFQDFQVSLFGKKKIADTKDSIAELTNKVKERMPKAFRDGLKSGLIKTAIASNMGALGSILLPGGPLGAVLLGMSSSFLKQSETFNRWMFGEQDEEGNRTGGVIPKNLIDLYNEHGSTIKKGAGAGILASFFLPGGPILGAITGIGSSLLIKSEAFQKFMFGDDPDNKSMMNGAVGKLIKSLSKKGDKAEANPELATFLGGAGLAAGIAQGVGFLPSMLLPGGPILGSIIGLSAGIAASSEKFQKFLFGEKDEDGQRYGGLITRVSNWFDTAVLGSLKMKMAEANDRMYKFLHEKVLFPIQDALMPIKQLGLNVLDDIKESFHNVTDPVVESFREHVTRPLGKWMKKHFMDPITKAIKGTFKLIGKAIGGILTSPIKLLTGLGNIADTLNARRALKEEKQNKRNQFKELVKEEGFSGLIKGFKNLKISDEDKQRILTTGKMKYRAEREEIKNEREAKLQAEMEERRSKRDELNRQFEEDMAFGKGSGWKWSSKKQKEKREQQLKEKQAWMQEKLTNETIDMSQRIKTIKDLLFDNLDIGDEQTSTLHSIKDLLYKLVTGKDPEDDIPNIDSLRKHSDDNVNVEDEVETVEAEIVNDGDHAKMPGMSNSSKKGIFKSIIDALRGAGQSHEDGLDEVPHDGYIAELHEGEMVLPEKPASKMRDMFDKMDSVSHLTDWVEKREEKEAKDRNDNALGLTDEEAEKIKEINDRKRYDDVSKQGVDYIMKRREEEQKEKEERQWRSSILEAIYAVGGGLKKGAEKSFDLLGLLGGLLGKLPGSLTNILKGLGITGALAGLTQLLGISQFKEYNNIAEENNDSILDVYQGEHRENRLDADGTYVYDNQLISTAGKLIRPGTMSALLKPEIVLYDKIVKPTIETGGKIINKSKKIGGKVVDYFNPNISKTGTTALGESYKYTMRKPDPTVGQKMMGKVADAATAVKNKSKGLFDEFMGMCKKALQFIMNKFVEKFPKLATSKVFSSLDEVVGSLAKYTDDIIKKFGKKIAIFIGDVALDVVPVVGQVTELCCTAYDVLTGLFSSGNVANMFGVPEGHIDNEMRVICSLLQGLCKFSAIAVIWILNEITTSFLGFDFIQMLARLIYSILPINLGKKIDVSNNLRGVKIDDMTMEEALSSAGLTYIGVDKLYEDRVTGKLKDFTKIKQEDLKGTGISSVELQELARHQYNLENGTQLDAAAWNDKVNKTFGSKIMDSAWGRQIRGITAAQHLGLDSTADVTLLDRFMSSAGTTGTAVMNIAGKLTGNEKLKNMTVQDAISKYSNWRNNQYNKKMQKLEDEITEKEAKGEDTTKLNKKLDKLKGKLGLSDSEYEELKASKNSGLMTGDAGMGEGEEFDSDKQKIVEVFNEDGTLSHCITVPIKETTEVEGFSSSEILKPVSEYNSNKMQGIPQYDEKGNLVSYTTVDKRKAKTGGLFSKITSAVGGLFGFGNGSSTTDNSVDNSSSVTNNTGNTYNTTNEIDTTPFAPLTEAINSLVGINMEENVDEEGRAKTSGVLKAIVDPMGFLFKNLLNVGINVKEGITGEETDPETVNKAVNTFKIIQNPFGYLYKLTKGYFDGDEESVETVNTVKDKWNETKENAKNKLNQGKEWVEGKWNNFNQWKDDKLNKANEWIDTKAQRSQETAAIMAGDKNAKANFLSTAISGSSDITAAIYNLFAKEDLTSGEIADATATFINKAIVTPFKMLTDPAVEKFNETKEAISEWVNEKKDAIVNWWKENISEPWDKNKEKAEETQQAIIDDVKARKDAIAGWWKENISEPWDKSKKRAEETQQAIIADVKARKDAIAGWWKENISEPWDKSKKRAEETQQAIIADVKDMKDKITGWFSDHIKKPFEDTKNKIKESISGWVKGFKEKIVNTFNTYIKDPVSEALSPVISAVSGAWNSFKSAFSPFVDLFDYITGKSDKSLTQIIKDYGSSGRENAGLDESSDETPTDNGVRSGAKSSDHIRPKKYRATDSDFITPTTNTTNNTTNTNTNTNNKFVFYNQSDSRWGQNRIGNDKMKDSGCGPTSLAMAISQLTGEQITPDTIAKLGKEHIPGYSKYSLFPSVAEKLNMNYNEGYDENFIVSNLEKGIPVLLSGKTNAKGTPYTSEGHVVTATRIKGDSIFINDPRGKEYSGYYPIRTVLEGLKKGMTVSPSNRTNVKNLSSGKLLNGWNGEEYKDVNKESLGLFGDAGEYQQLDDMSGKTGASQITMADRVLSYARAFLNNTSKFSYSQPRRLQIDNNKGNGADCSSFVSHVLSRAGDVNIYGTTSQTFWDSVGTKVDDPQIGDVVCQQGHVGLYSGDGNYIHMSGRKHGIKESKAIQRGNNKHRGYKRVLKNPSELVDPTVPNSNKLLGTVVGTPSGQPVTGGGETPSTSTPNNSTESGSSVNPLGVFGQLSNIASDMLTTMFGGQVTTDPGNSTPNDNVDISDINDTAKAVWTFFTNKGYTPEATAGIMGNMKQESQLDPTAIQGGGKGPAAGICQWENWRNNTARFKDMKAHAESKGKDWTDLQSQLEFIDIELQGKSPGDNYTSTLLKKNYGGYEGFKAITDYKKATEAFEKSFERAGKINWNSRYSGAEMYYNQFKNADNTAANADLSAGTGPATATNPETPDTSNGTPSSINGWAYYKQTDPQWQEDINNKKIGPSGCGMASHAMMLTTMFGKEINPVTVGKWARSKGYWGDGGMAWSMPPAIANLFGLEQPLELMKDGGASASDLESVKNELKSGKPVILSGKGQKGNKKSPFTSGGHIVLAVGVDGSNRLIINDPRGPEYTRAYEDSEVMDIGTGLRGAWSFNLNSNSAVPSDWTTGGTFTPGINNDTPGTSTPTNGSSTSSDPLGVFGQLSNIASEMLTTMFGGQVSSDPGNSTPGVSLPDGDFIGKVSAKYEVSYPSNRGDFISNGASWGDPGGTSYGLPQFATNTGSAKSFAEWLSGKVDTTLSSLTPNTSAFNTEWKAIPEKIGMDKFEQLQGQYAYQLLGEPFGNKWLQATGLTMKNRGFQEMLYSAGIQHGSGTAKKYSQGITSNMTDDAIVDKFYDNRGELNSTTGSVKEALKKRFAKERDDIKALLNSPVASTDSLNNNNTDNTPTDNTPTDDAGMGDGKTHWAKGFENNKPAKVSYTKGHAGMGEGDSATVQMNNVKRTMERSIREMDRNMTVTNTTNINNNVSDACVEILKTIVQELHYINNNTANTAKNVKDIKIVSENEPVKNNRYSENDGAARNIGMGRNKKDINHSNPNTGYDIARRIAAYK